MIYFLSKFENRGIKIARVKSILITISINLLFSLILYGVGFRCDRMRSSVLSPFIEKSMSDFIICALVLTVSCHICVSFFLRHRDLNYTKFYSISEFLVHWFLVRYFLLRKNNFSETW